MNNRFLKDFEQRRWAEDIERYDRMKELAANTRSIKVKEFSERIMTTIRARYPGKIKD